jgi:hypothetical protein
MYISLRRFYCTPLHVTFMPERILHMYVLSFKTFTSTSERILHSVLQYISHSHVWEDSIYCPPINVTFLSGMILHIVLHFTYMSEGILHIVFLYLSHLCLRAFYILFPNTFHISVWNDSIILQYNYHLCPRRFYILSSNTFHISVWKFPIVVSIHVTFMSERILHTYCPPRLITFMSIRILNIVLQYISFYIREDFTYCLPVQFKFMSERILHTVLD